MSEYCIRDNLKRENTKKSLSLLKHESRLHLGNIKQKTRRANIGNKFNDVVKPINGEPIIKKNVSSAFIGTDLKERLDKEKITKLVIVGLMTDVCVSTTTRMAGDFGFENYLVSDATATFSKKGLDGQTFSAEIVHKTALASLNDEFATIVTTEFIKQNI